jgi:hypothetical protein
MVNREITELQKLNGEMKNFAGEALKVLSRKHSPRDKKNKPLKHGGTEEAEEYIH